jgi:hypothetical protein
MQAAVDKVASHDSIATNSQYKQATSHPHHLDVPILMPNLSVSRVHDHDHQRLSLRSDGKIVSLDSWVSGREVVRQGSQTLFKLDSWACGLSLQRVLSSSYLRKRFRGGLSESACGDES